MVQKTHKYADGGKIVKRETNLMSYKPMKPHTPAKVKSPILEKAGSPGGPHTPGAKGTYPKKKKKKKGG